MTEIGQCIMRVIVINDILKKRLAKYTNANSNLLVVYKQTK